MGPHPGRKKLVVRIVRKEARPLLRKVPPAKGRAKPTSAGQNICRAQGKPKVRVPGPGVDRKPGLSVAEQRQRKRARLAALAWLKAAFPPCSAIRRVRSRSESAS